MADLGSSRRCCKTLTAAIGARYPVSAEGYLKSAKILERGQRQGKACIFGTAPRPKEWNTATQIEPASSSDGAAWTVLDCFAAAACAAKSALSPRSSPSGSAFATALRAEEPLARHWWSHGFSREVVRMTGDPLRYFASSPGVRRGYCMACGSSLSYQSEPWPNDIHLMLDAFDEPEGLCPQSHVPSPPLVVASVPRRGNT